jgi:glycosyltransferase involved in cell wall biosynthesis
MRVLMLAQWYPPLIGGEELHVRNLSRELVRRGHDVSVATLWQPDLPELEDDEGVRVYRVKGTVQRARRLFADGGRRSATPFPDPGTVAGIARVMDRERPQIVHAHNWLVHSFLPLKRPRGPRLVLSLHDFSLVCATKVMLRDGAACDGPAPAKCLACAAGHYGALKGAVTVATNWLSGSAELALVDLFLPVSTAVADGNRLGGRSLPYRVVPNFAPDAIVDVDPPHGDPRLPDDGYLLFVGAFGRLKGLDLLLRAYADLDDRPPLVLIGYPNADTADVLRGAPDGVLVNEAWPHADVMRAWAGATAGVIPSVCIEACPTTAIEAMATGTPIVGSRIGGIPDLVDDGDTGLLVPPGDVGALRAALARLVADPDLRQRLGAAARRRFAQFSASRVVPIVEEEYERLIQPSRAAQGVIAAR